MSAIDLPVTRVLSGPLGGDLQIGADLVVGAVSAVFFLRDPIANATRGGYHGAAAFV